MFAFTLAVALAIAVVVFGLMSIWTDDYQRENIKRELDHKYGRH